MVDVPTLLIALAAVGVTWRYRVPEPVLTATGAAAHLQRLADTRGLPLRAASAGLEPDPEIPRRWWRGSWRTASTSGASDPGASRRGDLMGAWRVVSFGCDLDGLVPPGVGVIRWDDVPAVSDGFSAARDAIVGRRPQLLDT